MPHPITRVAQSLRERKKLKTREAIQREALRLFEKQGYEETTIEQIAAAVEISPSTFFNYFPSKEDVVFYDAYDPMVASMLAARPLDEPLSVSFRQVLQSVASVFERDRDVILERSKLLLREPELKAGVWQQLENARDFLCALIAQRSDRDPHDLEIRVIVMALLGAIMEATQEWVMQDGNAPFADYINRALDLVRLDTQMDALAKKK
jgi:AcrR family transcriptional regulator